MAAIKPVAVKIVPLGGLGEIGLNLMVIECAGSALIIDAGVMFAEERELGGGLLLPDLAYLEQSRLKIEGIILTHAHEDHLGALPYLLRSWPAPVFGTEVTLAFARRGLAEDGLAGADLRKFAPGHELELGPFRVEPVRVTHSTPDSVALAIRTPAGLIVHSGDFKIDPSPVDGQLFDTDRFARLGEEGVTLLLSDSTNVERPGRSGSESSLKPVIKDLIARTRGRFFLSSFSSHLHRIRQLAEAAHEAGRYVVPLGRRMAQSVRLGIETGQLELPPGTFIEQAEADFLEPRRLAFLASGSQGEPLSALAKLAVDGHPRVRIAADDAVVLSSRFIPGNERTINTLVNHLCKRGAEVYYDAVAPVHVSGHACRDELAELIRLVRPKHFIPIHGEYRHLTGHRKLAIAAGVTERNCFLLENGETLVLEDGAARRGRTAPAGRIVADGEDLGGPELMRERRTLAHDGTVIAIVAISARDGKIVAGPDLLSRGVVSGDGSSPHLTRARTELALRIRGLNGFVRDDPERLKEEMVRMLRRYFSDAIRKRPMIVPYVVEV
ncbi:MAG: ribonuclease J [Candidatus Binataceae bacterium]|nr:ribonuclease J [Candidatus Binataceae bacterium]